MPILLGSVRVEVDIVVAAHKVFALSNRTKETRLGMVKDSELSASKVPCPRSTSYLLCDESRALP